MEKIIIAIDGFSSCGKSTMAKDLAKQIGYIYIDSGAMYRAVTLCAMQQGLINETTNSIDEEGLKTKLKTLNIEFRMSGESKLVETYLNGVNVEAEIRGMAVSNKVSTVSALPYVRQKVDSILHQMGEVKGVVMDGRDIGTSVFPKAEMKVFVTASPQIRAQRRYDELQAKGDTNTSFDEVLENIKNRDYQDQNREKSPLRQAKDAVVLDNSTMTKDEQMKWLLDLFGSVLNKLNE